MNQAGAQGLRTLAFGDVDGGLWAGALEAGPSGALAFGDGAEAVTTLTAPELRWAVDGRVWRLAGPGVELEVGPRGEEAHPDGDVSSPEGIQELCDVRGTLTLGGSARAVDCIGARTAVLGLDPAALGSIRAVSGWFADDEALTLLAMRPAGKPNHDSDMIAATLFDHEAWLVVADPRLSTTYTAAGLPSRASLELWIGEGENEFPRRAAGEATGAGGELTSGDLQLRVAPLHCHSRGLEGSGVYLLATR